MKNLATIGIVLSIVVSACDKKMPTPTNDKNTTETTKDTIIVTPEADTLIPRDGIGGVSSAVLDEIIKNPAYKVEKLDHYNGTSQALLSDPKDPTIIYKVFSEEWQDILNEAKVGDYIRVDAVENSKGKLIPLNPKEED
jgi:lipoprotein